MGVPKSTETRCRNGSVRAKQLTRNRVQKLERSKLKCSLHIIHLQCCLLSSKSLPTSMYHSITACANVNSYFS